MAQTPYGPLKFNQDSSNSSQKKEQCSALIFQVLIQTDVSCKLCTVLSESFLSCSKQPSCISPQKGFRQTNTRFAARISLDKK